VTSPPAADAPARNEFAAGWRVVAASALGTMCGITAVPAFSLPAFVQSLTAEFGWSRAEIIAGAGICSITIALVSPFVGAAVDRFGARRVALASVVGVSIGLALVSVLANSLFGFYAAFVLATILGAGTSPVTWTRTVNGWFDKQRGLALGLTLMGTGIFSALGPAYATWAIGAFGWRGGYVALAAVPLVLALPFTFLWFREARPDEVPSPHRAAAAAASGASVGEALRSYKFWVIGTAFFLISACVAGMIGNLFPLLTDSGFTRESAAATAGLIGIAIIVGRVGVGILIDRLWAPAVGAVVVALPALACIILANGGLTPTTAAAAAILIGLAAGAEFDLVAFLAVRYFGLKNYGKIYAYLFGALIGGSAFGGVGFASAFDRTGSYDPALWTAFVLYIVCAASLLTLGRYARYGEESASG
jgi:MFS family permease